MRRAEYVRLLCALLQLGVRQGEACKLVITLPNYHIHIGRDGNAVYSVPRRAIWKLNKQTAHHFFKENTPSGNHCSWFKEHAEIRIFPAQDYMSIKFLGSLVRISRAVHFVHAAP